MNAIVNTAPDVLEWRDWPTPNPGPGQVRIRTAACGIFATGIDDVRGPKLDRMVSGVLAGIDGDEGPCTGGLGYH